MKGRKQNRKRRDGLLNLLYKILNLTIKMSCCPFNLFKTKVAVSHVRFDKKRLRKTTKL